MKRAAINLFTTLSLLLFLASLALWLRSYWRLDSLVIYRPDRQWTQLWIDRSTITMSSGRVLEADSRRGVLRLLYLNNDGSYWRAWDKLLISNPLAPDPLDDFDLFLVNSPDIIDWTPSTVLGFALDKEAMTVTLYNNPPGNPSTYNAGFTYALYTPHAFWAGLFLLLPAIRLALYARARRRTKLGLCRVCGYDLRASEGKCPECGTPKAG